MTSNPTSPATSVWTALLAAGCIAAVALIAAGLQPLRSDLYWWYAAVGEFISTWQAVPDRQLFLYTVDPEQPWVYHSWLGAVALSMLDQLGGADLALLARNLAVGLSAGVVTFALARRHGRFLPVLVPALVAAVGFAWFIQTEPHALAAPLAVVAVLAVFAVLRRPGHVLAALVPPVVAVAMVNLEVSVALAVAVAALVAAVLPLLKLRQTDDKRRIAVSAVALVATVPAVLFGFAYGPGAFGETLPIVFSAPATLPVILAIATVTSVLVAALWRMKPTDQQPTRGPTTAVLVATAAFAIFAPATSVVFVTAAALVIAAILAAAANPRPLPSIWRLCTAFVLFTTAAVLLQPGVDTRATVMTTLYDDVRTTAPHVGTMTDDLPLRCAEELRRTSSDRRLFHHPDDAGFLLYHLLDPGQPRALLFDDHRALIDADLRKRAGSLRDGPVARGNFQLWEIDAAVLDRQLYPEATRELDDAPEWHDLREDRDERFGCYVLTQ